MSLRMEMPIGSEGVEAADEGVRGIDSIAAADGAGPRSSSVDGVGTPGSPSAVNWREISDTRHFLTRKRSEISVRVMEFRGIDGGYVLIFGDAEQCADPLVRIHSRCLYGDALRSDDCDCGAELEQSMDLIQCEGAGILVYLEQEGRGAGLIVKAMGLRISDETGCDTFEAYEAMGVAHDLRRFDDVAELLRDGLGLRTVRLLTNNPHKVEALTARGIDVRSRPLRTVPRSARARKYLEAKRVRRQHDLPPVRAWTWILLFRRVCIATATVGIAAISLLILHEIAAAAYLGW